MLQVSLLAVCLIPSSGEQTQTFPLQRAADSCPHKHRNVQRVCFLAEVGVSPDSGEYTHFQTSSTEACNQILRAHPSRSLTFLQPLATFGTATTNATNGGSKKGIE